MSILWRLGSKHFVLFCLKMMKSRTTWKQMFKLTCCRIRRTRPSWIPLHPCFPPQRMNQSPSHTHTQPINESTFISQWGQFQNNVLVPTFPVAVFMSLAQPSTEPVSTREPSLLHARQVSAPWCPSWPVKGHKHTFYIVTTCWKLRTNGNRRMRLLDSPLMTWIAFPCFKSHTRTVPSS